MAEPIGGAVLELSTKDGGFRAGVQQAESAAKRLDKRFDEVSESISRAGGALRDFGQRATLFVTAPLAVAAGAAIKAASDVQEASNLIQVTFGDATDAMWRWADATAEAMGRSRYELAETAGRFAAFASALGIARDAAIPMSKALAQLTTDLSSFYNVPESDVFTNLMSALAGETEAVRKFGVDISDAAVQQEALNRGWATGAGEISQLQKVLARFLIIQRQTTAAQGDAARTIEGFANQCRVLESAVYTLRVRFGELHLGLATELVSSLAETVYGLSRLNDETLESLSRLAAVVAGIPLAVVALGTLVQVLGFCLSGVKMFVSGTIALLGLAVGAFSKFFDVVSIGLVRFVTFIGSMPGLIAVGLAAVAGAFVFFRDTVTGVLKGLLTAAKDNIVRGWNNEVVVPFQEAVNRLIDAANSIPLIGLEIEPIKVNDVVEGSIADDLKKVFAEAKENATREAREMADGISELTDGAVDRIKSLIPSGVLDFFFPQGFDEFKRDLATMFDPAAGGIAGAGESIDKLAALVAALAGESAGAANAQNKLADAVKKTREQVSEIVDQLRFEIDLLGKSEAQQRAMTLARQAGVAMGSKEYQQILDLVLAHEKEKKAIEDKDKLKERGLQLEESLRTEEEIRADRLAELNLLLNEGVINQETYNRALKDIEKNGRALDTTMTSLGATFTSAFEDAIVGAASFSDALKGLLDDITRIILRTQVLGPLATSLTGFIGGLFGASSSGPPAASGPIVTAAGGGEIPPNTTALVGELGPEILRTGSRPATVIPNTRIGGDVTVNIVNSGPPMEVESQQIRTGPGGEQTIDVVVRSSIERLVGNGQMDKILSPYAMRRQVAY